MLSLYFMGNPSLNFGAISNVIPNNPKKPLEDHELEVIGLDLRLQL